LKCRGEERGNGVKREKAEGREAVNYIYKLPINCHMVALCY